MVFTDYHAKLRHTGKSLIAWIMHISVEKSSSAEAAIGSITTTVYWPVYFFLQLTQQAI